MNRGINLRALLLLVAGAGLLVRCWPERSHCGEASSRVSTTQLVTHLRQAIMQYTLDRGVVPTLTPGRSMSEEEGFACLFQLLGAERRYFALEDDMIVGGLSGVEGEGACGVEPGLPLGTILDVWGNGIRYRTEALEPEGYDLYSPGPDGVARTEDDIVRYDPDDFPPAHGDLLGDDGRRVGLLVALVMLAVGALCLRRRRGIGRPEGPPLSSPS